MLHESQRKIAQSTDFLGFTWLQIGFHVAPNSKIVLAFEKYSLRVLLEMLIVSSTTSSNRDMN
jgi:hypothetical protein